MKNRDVVVDTDDISEEVVVKKDKKKKTNEEKRQDRMIVFWCLVAVLVFTFVFWIKSFMQGQREYELSPDIETNSSEEKKEKDKVDDFYIEYKI